MAVPDAEGYVMVLQPEEPKISLSGIDHFARSAAEFESQEGVTLFPELRIVSTITREVETDTESEVAEGTDDDPTGIYRPGRDTLVSFRTVSVDRLCCLCFCLFFDPELSLVQKMCRVRAQLKAACMIG